MTTSQVKVIIEYDICTDMVNVELSEFSCNNNYDIDNLENLLKDKLVIKDEIKDTEELENIKYINNRIKEEICYEIINQLTDNELLPDYKNCKSVKNNIEILGNILQKHIDIDEKIKQNILDECLLELLIPAGTKGVMRGNKFNNIIKDFIKNLGLDQTLFEIYFEKKCKEYFTTEIPDWYILEKKTNKIIIGMNQLDLWKGGQQLNRGSKYIEDNKHNSNNSKLLCVICNEIQFTSTKNKAYNLFKMGFKNNTLCYIKNLKNIIKSYFNIL